MDRYSIFGVKFYFWIWFRFGLSSPSLVSHDSAWIIIGGFLYRAQERGRYLGRGCINIVYGMIIIDDAALNAFSGYYSLKNFEI